jgi:hypothetical protein
VKGLLLSWDGKATDADADGDPVAALPSTGLRLLHHRLAAVPACPLLRHAFIVQSVSKLVNTSAFQNTITSVIMLAGLLAGLQTYPGIADCAWPKARNNHGNNHGNKSGCCSQDWS